MLDNNIEFTSTISEDNNGFYPTTEDISNVS